MSDATEGVGEAGAAKEKADEAKAEEAKPSEAAPAEEAKGDAPAPEPPAAVAMLSSAAEEDPAGVAKPGAGGEEHPSEGKEPPVEAAKPSPEGEAPSAKADEPSPAGGEEPPAEAAKPSPEGEAPSAEAAKPSPDGDATPAEAEKPSPDGDATPAEGAEAAAPAEAAPEPEPEPAPEPVKAPPPAITGIEPATIGVKGGAIVTILGCDFARGCAVLIDDTPVPSARAHAGRLEAVASPHAAGVVDVAVKNPDGQRVTLPAALRFAEPPVIEAITPARGVTTGGFEVTLTGRHFEAGTAVLFAGAPVAEVSFVSETELRVRVPGHAAEAVEVGVVCPNGLSHRLPSAFTYEIAPPRIASLEPAFGPNAGGTRVTIRGTDLDAKCAVYVCGLAAVVAWKSREEIEVVMPEVARDGLVDVRLVNPDDQAATLDKAFRYDAPLAPPALASVSPNKGSQVGGTKVTLYGEDFAEGAVVRFAGVAAAEVKFLNKKQLEAVTPAYAGSGEVGVEVVNPDGVASALENAFTYEARPAPSITGITPTFGPSTGGTKVVIEGTNFTKDCQVYVGREYPKDLAIKSATEIHFVTAPRKTAGVVDVEVAAPGLPKAVMKNGFRYDAVPAPVITSVSPNAGAVAGGTEMSITGKNFRKDTIVLVDGKQPKTVKLVDAQTLEFKTPPGDAGKMVDVIVRNPDGKEALQKRAFLYDPRYR